MWKTDDKNTNRESSWIIYKDYRASLNSDNEPNCSVYIGANFKSVLRNTIFGDTEDILKKVEACVDSIA